MDTKTLWYDDRDELVGFINWFWEGAFNTVGATREVIDCVLQPWLFDKEYKWFVEDREEQKVNR